MKSIIPVILLAICLNSSAQDEFNGFVPFKVELCGQLYYNASPQMIGVMKSHIGDYMPPDRDWET